ncbi:hypothetical protein KO505_12045 [Psychrosphaera sp. F3M07]|uniref:type VI secretion protein IcmF/TssM N-terminal domain-containing protein n=1 Tax=Psychrosphaera sp. F3M07 TaxID=2841560 RepID=UPI001C08440F|nr:hypothetical protein [Psychrosphaera sp. F3M07]
MKKFLKFLLILFVWLLIAVAVIGGTVMAGFELDLGIKIFVFLFVGWLAFLLIRKIVINYRSKKKVENLVNVEQAEKSSWNFGFSMGISPLKNNFTSMIKMLKKSYLKVHGDPMYVLPWYLMIGNSSSGKTQALESANLPSPTIDKDSVTDLDCGINWVLYNQGIVIDTPGDYLASQDSNNRNSDWLQLLGLLKKHRAKEPINGVIVSLSITDLISGNSQKLIEVGIQSRKNIEQLMQQLHVQVPVYVMITNLDALPGINEWSIDLDEQLLKDPLGEVNNDSLPVSEFIKTAVGNISERLKQLLLASIKNEKVSSNLLMLPTNFEQLERHLSTFTETLFQTNPYQKTPFFRGIYFVGQAKAGVQQNNHSGIFSNRFFTEIIPSERNMVSSLASTEKIAQKQRLGKTFAWNAVFAVMIGLLYVGYDNDVETLDQLINENAGSFENSNNLPRNISSLYQYRDMVNVLQNHSWIPWFGISGKPEFITKLEGMFSERVQARLVEQTDLVFSRELANSFTRDADISEEKIVSFISTLVRRINIIDAYMDGQGQDYLETMPSPYSYSDASFFGINEDATVDRLNTLYLQSLAWITDKNLLKQEVVLLNEQLHDILIKSKNLSNWMIPWANEVAKSNEVRISDFWTNTTGKMKNDVIINGAYTIEGKAVIDDFIGQIKATGRYDEILDNILPGFEEEYKKRYLGEWEKFALNFSRGSEKLSNRDEWLNVINNLSTGRNIYFNALNTVEKQIQPYKDDAELPDWVTMVMFYQDMRAFAPEEKTDGAQNKMLTKMALKIVGKAGPLGKALAKSGKKGLKTQKKMAKGASGPSPDERQMQLEAAGQLLGEYRQSLADFVYSAEMRSVSHAAVATLYQYPDNPAEGESPLAMSYASLKQLQAIVGKESNTNKAFWNLYSGAIDLMQQYMISESSCEIQNIWNDEFLTNLEGVPTYKVPNMAFGPDGILWTMLSDQLAPFVTERFGAGYVATKVDKTTYPINSDFLTFAARAKDGKQSKQEEYLVRLDAIPTSTNLDSKFSVSETRLELQCAAGPMMLINKNFFNSEVFKWTDACSTVNLTINVGRFVLEKKFEGALGFPNFLKAFKTGQKRYTANDFPEYAQSLRESGISFIDVKYRMSGQEELLRSLNSKKLSIPRKISSCWEGNVATLSAAKN